MEIDLIIAACTATEEKKLLMEESFYIYFIFSLFKYFFVSL